MNTALKRRPGQSRGRRSRGARGIDRLDARRRRPRYQRLGAARRPADRRRMRGPGGPLRRRARLPQHDRDGAARLRPRRIQILRLSAAGHRRRAAAGALCAAGADRQSLERGDGHRGALSGDARGFIARCHAAGQTRPTPLLLQYGAGDYNCLHQDLYGEHVFPLQVAILLSEPDKDFTGGEFVLTEQRPRMQSRAEVVPLKRGDAAVFAVHHRPVQGTRGFYRVNMRHGVSRLRPGTATPPASSSTTRSSMKDSKAHSLHLRHPEVRASEPRRTTATIRAAHPSRAASRHLRMTGRLRAAVPQMPQRSPSSGMNRRAWLMLLTGSAPSPRRW